MIYSINNEPLVLTEDAADAFLESVGVELYDDEISINGTLYEGSYGESILESNGIFLYEDGIVLEGKQAEEYKARKAKEKEDRDIEHDKYFKHHGYGSGNPGAGSRMGVQHPNYIKDSIGILNKDDSKLRRKAEDRLAKKRAQYEDDRDQARANAYMHLHKYRSFDSKQPDSNLSKQGQEMKKQRYRKTADKHFKLSQDEWDKHDRAAHKVNLTLNKNTVRAVMRNEKKKLKHSTNESTIFSDIDII